MTTKEDEWKDIELDSIQVEGAAATTTTTTSTTPIAPTTPTPNATTTEIEQATPRTAANVAQAAHNLWGYKGTKNDDSKTTTPLGMFRVAHDAYESDDSDDDDIGPTAAGIYFV